MSTCTSILRSDHLSDQKSKHNSGDDAAMKIMSKTILTITLGLATLSHAHAEQYCKSVDKYGNATYTLAPEKGCSSKKFKTIAIHRSTASAPARMAATSKSEAKPDAVKTDAETMGEPPKALVPQNAPIGEASIQPSQVQDK